MHSQLFVVALAASVSANLFPAHVPIKREHLVARQTDAPTATGSSDADCQATLLSIATELPMPDDDLLSWEEAQTATDPCSISDVPSSLSSDYTSYTDAVLSWYSASSSELLAALSACPQYAGAASEVQVCTSLAAGAATTGSGSSATTSATGSGSESSATGSAASKSSGSATKSGSSGSTGSATGSASSSTETAGAPMREVGVMGAVLAGVLGVAVAL
ncbi:hypothetical protein diail_10845 [Diaporthe ilicicola]|nr:hypothetical protein diail_10845 [Diaporthe ilicicola]